VATAHWHYLLAALSIATPKQAKEPIFPQLSLNSQKFYDGQRQKDI
jgi:hypothetical protein